MEIEAIVYQTSAGTTRRYAEALSRLTGLPAVPLKEGKKSLAGRPVLYMSWLCSGLLMNYERAAKTLDIRGVCATGVGSEELARHDLSSHHDLSGENVFFLPGVFDMKKLGFLQRKTMKDMEQSLKYKLRDPKRVTEADRATYDMLRNGADHFNEQALAPVAEWLSRKTEDSPTYQNQ